MTYIIKIGWHAQGFEASGILVEIYLEYVNIFGLFWELHSDTTWEFQVKLKRLNET